MAWIELHQSVWTHKKTIMLAAILDIDELYAAAHMAKFWTWALDNVQDGDLTGLLSRVIAVGAGWKGGADEFLEAMIQAEWVDRGEDGKTTIHDWHDYAGRLIDKKTANKQRMRNARAKKNGEKPDNDPDTKDERATHVQRTDDARAGATLPNLTLPKEPPPPTEENASDEPTDNRPVEAAKPAYESYFKAHQRLFGFPPSKTQRDELNDFIDVQGLDESVVIRALERADSRGGGYSFRLITSILHDYQLAGATSLDKAIEFDAAFEANKQARRSDSKVTPWRRRVSHDERGRSDERVRGEYDGLSL